MLPHEADRPLPQFPIMAKSLHLPCMELLSSIIVQAGFDMNTIY